MATPQGLKKPVCKLIRSRQRRLSLLKLAFALLMQSPSLQGWRFESRSIREIEHLR